MDILYLIDQLEVLLSESLRLPLTTKVVVDEEEFLNIIVAFFRGQLVIAFLQGLLFAIGFTVVGLKYGFVIGLTLGFLNIVPYLGNIIGLGTALPLAFFQEGGGIVQAVGRAVPQEAGRAEPREEAQGARLRRLSLPRLVSSS